MPDFVESLQGKDLGHLRAIAHLWKIDLLQEEEQPAVLHLKATILTPNRVGEMFLSLGEEVRAALDDLRQHSGRLPWAQFSRTYGEVREMGSAKRDRDRPYDNPISAAEALWYRGILARAFFDTPKGPVEFAYIPEDVLLLFPATHSSDVPLMGRPASSAEYAQTCMANDRILDHSCTYLAAMRSAAALPERFPSAIGEALLATGLQAILLAAGLVDNNGQPYSEPVRQFLEARRGESLLQLFRAWITSPRVNELRLLPGLISEGNWSNDPLRTRQAVIGWLSGVQKDTWWSLGSFVSAIKQRSPDFQRPAGDYDSWFIKDKASGEYLRGFTHWDEVDGRLVRFLISGPLYWLGVLDLAGREGEEQVTAFRLSRWSRALLQGEEPRGLALEKEPLIVRSDARLSARRLTPRSVRYQLSRFCDWERETPDDYQFRISPRALLRAQQQGLKVSQLVTMLNRYARAVPPSLVNALERWAKMGSEARIEKMAVLRVSSEEILHELRKSRAGRLLGEPLGPTTTVVKPGAMDKVLGILAELGYLGEIRGESE